MRIAFSGSHRVGKSSLVERLADALPRYAIVEEPYYLLEEDGYECNEVPSLEDFEAQLDRSFTELEQGRQDVLFDRCPADVFAYLLTHEDADSFDADDRLERARAAMQTLDLIVFVPIEETDRIVLPGYEDRDYRQAVHDKLHEILMEDALGLVAEVVTVTVEGSVEERAEQVMSRMRRSRRG